MSKLTPGLDILHALDRQIARSRKEVGKASALPERATDALVELRQREADAFDQIARDRLDLLFEGGSESNDLGYADRQARRLMDGHEAEVAEAEAELARVTGELERLEGERRKQERRVADAVTLYDKRAADAEMALLEDPDYTARVARMADLDEQIERAGAKLEVARADREEKGRAYESDPLFSYLRERGYGTPDAKGWFLTQALDGLVARHIGYRRAGETYRRLVEIPERLENHLERLEAAREAAEAELARVEAEWLDAQGVSAVHDASLEEQARLEVIDAELSRTEDAHEAARRHVAALHAGEAGPQRDAIRLLSKVLTTQSRTELRHLAAQTATLDDDRAVEEIADLAKIARSLEEDHAEAMSILRRVETSLHTLEHVRRNFKTRRYESPNSAFKRADMLLSLIRDTGTGAVTGKRLWKEIARNQRTVQRYSDPGFGGGVWDDALGLPRAPRTRRVHRRPRRRVSGGPIIIGGGVFGGGGFGGGGLGGGGFGGGFGGGLGGGLGGGSFGGGLGGGLGGGSFGGGLGG